MMGNGVLVEKSGGKNNIMKETFFLIKECECYINHSQYKDNKHQGTKTVCVDGLRKYFPEAKSEICLTVSKTSFNPINEKHFQITMPFACRPFLYDDNGESSGTLFPSIGNILQDWYDCGIIDLYVVCENLN